MSEVIYLFYVCESILFFFIAYVTMSPLIKGLLIDIISNDYYYRFILIE